MRDQSILISAEEDFLDWLSQRSKLSQNTLYLYKRYYKRFVEFLGDSKLSQEVIDNFFRQEKIKNSISISVMVNLSRYLKEKGCIKKRYKIPKKRKGENKDKKIIREFPPEKIKMLREIAYKKNHGLIFDLLYYGALRRSEVSKIKVNSFNWFKWLYDQDKAIELKLEHTKGDKERIVLIPKGIAKEIIYLLTKKLNFSPQTPEDLVEFLTLNNAVLFGKAKGHRVWKIIKKLSKEQIRPHELRHARATELEKQGLSIRAIQHYLGHASPKTTELYLHTSEKHSLNQIREIADIE